MNRNQAKALLPIIQAYAEGRTVEFKDRRFKDEWDEMSEFPDSSFKHFEFRIKPKLKYRPFKDAEECWAEIQKHQPVGFVKFKNTKSGYYMVTFIASGAIVGMNNIPFSYEDIFDSYTFADGTPFGVKEEE